jgi:hypothetical protein
MYPKKTDDIKKIFEKNVAKLAERIRLFSRHEMVKGMCRTKKEKQYFEQDITLILDKLEIIGGEHN